MGVFEGCIFPLLHVIIPRPGAECNNCKPRSSNVVTDPGFQIIHSGSAPDSLPISISRKKVDPGVAQSYRLGPIGRPECPIGHGVSTLFPPFPHRFSAAEMARRPLNPASTRHQRLADILNTFISMYSSGNPIHTPYHALHAADSSSRDYGLPCSLAFTFVSGMFCMRHLFPVLAVFSFRPT